MYLRGRLLSKDEAKAYAWLKRAADHRDVYACYYLGLLYEEGIGVKRDTAQAQAWYVKAGKTNYNSTQDLVDQDIKHLRELGISDAPLLH
jgi:hypothetical protein